jgi:antirestriction protein
MLAFADKLLHVTEQHSKEISDQWCKAISLNPKTPALQALTREKCVEFAVEFYQNLRRIYFDEPPYKQIEKYFERYAEDRFREGVPLHEAVYALVMLRRQMWLYADFQAIFTTALDQYKAVESINRTIRLFDQGIYIITKKYGELEKVRKDRK